MLTMLLARIVNIITSASGIKLSIIPLILAGIIIIINRRKRMSSVLLQALDLV